MSVRPVSVSEETKAFGHPFVNIFSLFGLTQGLLIYLNRTRIPVTQNWFSVGHPALFGALVLGGYFVGGAVAMGVYSDWNVVRLMQRHKEDQDLLVEGQSIRNYQTTA